MFFKRVRFLQLSEKFTLSIDGLADRLHDQAFRPCRSADSVQIGWGGILAQNTDLFYASHGLILIKFVTQEKILPAREVNKKLEARIGKSELEDGSQPKKRKSATQDSVRKMQPSQLASKTLYVKAYLDIRNKLLVLEANSDTLTDRCIKFLRHTLGELLVEPPQKYDLSQAMAKWMIRNAHDLSSMANGRRVNELSLTWNEKIDFILTENFTLKDIKFLETITNANNNIVQDTPADRLSLDFILMSEIISDLIQCLLVIFQTNSGAKHVGCT